MESAVSSTLGCYSSRHAPYSHASLEMGRCCLVSVSRATAVCSVQRWLWAGLLQGKYCSKHGTCWEDHGITTSPKAMPRAPGAGSGQSSDAPVRNPLGASLLLCEGCWLCNETQACTASESGGVIRKCRSSNSISPVQCSWEEFLLDLLPLQSSSY